MLSPTTILERRPAASCEASPPQSSDGGLKSAARNTPWLSLTVVALALLWCYWPTLATMADRWSNESQYSHGFLVPLFALAVLLVRRPAFLPSWQPCWWGAALMGFALGIRLVSAEIDNQTLDSVSLLVMLTGAVLLMGGWRVLGWTWPAIAFLGFMLPLPFTVEVALSHPLQRLATTISTYALQTFGLPAFAEGNIITIDQIRLGVVEACSGLGMLMTFFALSTAMGLIVKAPLADRLLIVASAVPIAVIANVVRITATGAAYYQFGDDSELAKAIMHDGAGWLMMPLALGLLWLELKYLGWLFLRVDEQPPVHGWVSEALPAMAGPKPSPRSRS